MRYKNQDVSEGGCQDADQEESPNDIGGVDAIIRQACGFVLIVHKLAEIPS